MIWRPVDSGFATLREVSDDWNLDDLLDSHHVLNYRQDLEAEAARKQ